MAILDFMPANPCTQIQFSFISTAASSLISLQVLHICSPLNAIGWSMISLRCVNLCSCLSFRSLYGFSLCLVVYIGLVYGLYLVAYFSLVCRLSFIVYTVLVYGLSRRLLQFIL